MSRTMKFFVWAVIMLSIFSWLFNVSILSFFFKIVMLAFLGSMIGIVMVCIPTIPEETKQRDEKFTEEEI